MKTSDSTEAMAMKQEEGLENRLQATCLCLRKLKICEGERRNKSVSELT